MNSTENNTPLGYKHRSNVTKLFGQSVRMQNSYRRQNNLVSQSSHSRRVRGANSFDIFPVVKTPPTKRLSKVKNPFEPALAERLHLPIIGSPTLFQCPTTPQHSSTKFAWTIDDVSSLQPANVEPHETQFHDSPDSEYEAKAQSAISSYFKDQLIVPSPIDCPLRNQRIVLEVTGNTPISKPGRRIRDNTSQTVLSLPPILPKELEIALEPFFNFHECQQQTNNVSNTSTSAIEFDLRDASLRRKLFDQQNAMFLEDDINDDVENCALTINSPPPMSPDFINTEIVEDKPFCRSRLSDNMDKTCFGSLSPIAQNSSPQILKRKSHFNSSCSLFGKYDNYRCVKVDDFSSPFVKNSPMYYFTTPEPNMVHKSSPYRLSSEKSTDSLFNAKIKGLVVDTAKRAKMSALTDFTTDDTQDIDENEMQLSSISSNSSGSDTPRSERRFKIRKNLSQSFSFQSPSKTEIDDDFIELAKLKKIDILPTTDWSKDNFNEKIEQVLDGHPVLNRTDSGFNEMATSKSQYDTKLSDTELDFQSLNKSICKKRQNFDPNADESMMCCSTPSKYFSII